MKILQITAQGVPLFKSNLEISFYGKQRVYEDDRRMLYPLLDNVYLNSTTAFIGINASGKTSVLKVILLALGIINNEPLNHIENVDILGNTEEAIIKIYFINDCKQIGLLETVITSERMAVEGIRYRIISEKLWLKETTKSMLKKEVLNFQKMEPAMIRNHKDEFLPEDVSIIIAQNKKNHEHAKTTNLLSFTNHNVLSGMDEISMDIIKFLDPTVEKLFFDKNDTKAVLHLKFAGKEEILINNPADLGLYLSSGTIKGIETFTKAKEVLKSGGYLVVDEIENHFNKEIVTTLIRLFMDSGLNKNGGSLVFTTHYPELLDEFERNDAIYITRNRGGITAENLSNILKRNDIKKSEAYESGFLGGTTPMYEAYMDLKRSMINAL